EPRTVCDRDGYLAELRDLREFFRKGPAGRRAAPVAGLKGEDDAILQALAAARPFPMTQEKLEGETGLSLRTLRPPLRFLRGRRAAPPPRRRQGRRHHHRGRSGTPPRAVALLPDHFLFVPPPFR